MKDTRSRKRSADGGAAGATTPAGAAGTPDAKLRRAASSGKRRKTSSAWKRRRRLSAAALQLQIESLPDGALAAVFRHLGLGRLAAMQVCKRWRDLASAAEFSITVEGKSIMAAIDKAKPGDTILIPPGYYQETLLVDKPLKLVGLPSQDVQGRPRNGVVLQSSRPLVALCNARTCFQRVVMRAVANTGDRSIVSFGPACEYIRLDDCHLNGFSGLILPATKPKAQLVLLGCAIYGVQDDAAISVEAGLLRMHGCTVTNCQMAVAVGEAATALLRNNDLSFNAVAVSFSGHGMITENVLWGNLHRSAVGTSDDIAPELVADDAAAGGIAGQQPAEAAAGVEGPLPAEDQPGNGQAAVGVADAASDPPAAAQGAEEWQPGDAGGAEGFQQDVAPEAGGSSRTSMQEPEAAPGIASPEGAAAAPHGLDATPAPLPPQEGPPGSGPARHTGPSMRSGAGLPPGDDLLGERPGVSEEGAVVPQERPVLVFARNHVQMYSRDRQRASAAEQRVRRKVRRLAREVYGTRPAERAGLWDDWQLVGEADGDTDSEWSGDDEIGGGAADGVATDSENDEDFVPHPEHLREALGDSDTDASDSSDLDSDEDDTTSSDGSGRFSDVGSFDSGDDSVDARGSSPEAPEAGVEVAAGGAAR